MGNKFHKARPSRSDEENDEPRFWKEYFALEVKKPGQNIIFWVEGVFHRVKGSRESQGGRVSLA